MAFLCRQVHPLQEVKINHESYDFGWYTLDAIKVLPKLIPSTMDVLKYVYLYYRLFEIGALAVIRKGDKFLMTKVNAPHDTQVHGKWGFIAGMSEPYETLEQTLKRECLEEVGINIEIQHMIPFVKEEDNFKLFCYVARMTDTSQPIVINHEATEWGWFDLHEASELDTFGDTLKILSLVV
jgi:8-oxo-dGTP diphosphatase